MARRASRVERPRAAIRRPLAAAAAGGSERDDDQGEWRVNLTINAAQAMEQHRSPIREIRIVADAPNAAEIRVSVSDTGPGIAPELVDRVFESFVTTKPSGLGIGLSICRTIVESHGGLMRAHNGERGAVFSFTLPVEPELADGKA